VVFVGCRRLVIDVFVGVLVKIPARISKHSEEHMCGVAAMSLCERR